MKFGIMFANLGDYTKGRAAVRLAQTAEEAGFDSVWAIEHVVVPAGDESTYPYDTSGRLMAQADDVTIPDPLIWLSWVGAATTRVQLCTGVMILPQRNPVVLAKEVATLDDLSEGRVRLGVGVGWLAEEFEAIGVPFEARGRRTDDYIAAMRALWQQDLATHHGEFSDFEDIYLRPQPAAGTVPILIGGHTEPAARRAGRLGDGFFPAKGGPSRLGELFDVMRSTAERAGRDPSGIELTTGGKPEGSYIERLAGLGVSRMILPAVELDQIERWGVELCEGFADLQPALRLSNAVARRRYDREILRLAVPATAALAAEPLYILADLAIVGRLGTPQLGGLAVAATLLLTGHSLVLFLAYGTTAAVGRLVGAGEHAGAAHAGVQGLWLAVGLGVVLGTAGLALAEPAMGLMGASGPVRPYALTYFRISLLGVPALLVTMAATGYLRGLQDFRATVVLAVSSAVANLGLEILLVLVLGLGVAGSAWSTVAVQVVVAAVCGRLILRPARRLGVPWGPDLAALRRLARVSADLFVRSAALRLSFTLATAVAARIGVIDLGAHQVAFELWSFLALVLDGLAIAAQASVGRRLGAGDIDGARSSARRMIEWGVALGFLVGALVLVTRPWMPGLFSDDDEVRELTAFLLLWVAVLQPVNGAVFVLDGILIGAGDLRFLAWAMALAAVTFVPAAGAVLVLDLGIGWLWVALALLMGTRLAALGWRFAGPAWAVPGAVRN